MMRFHELRSALGICLCAALSGCGGAAPPQSREPSDLPALGALFGRASADRGEALTVDERKQVLSTLRIRGVDVSSARYAADDMLLVEGDMVFDARRVLQDAQEDVDKGYFWKTAVTVSKYKDIHAAPDPTFPPDAIWTWAVVYGGSNWNANTHVAFTTAAAPAGSAILDVGALDFSAVDPSLVCYLALTSVPSGGQPGVIALNSTFHWGTGGCTNTNIPAACRAASLDSLTWDQMVHTTTHEMGHALGFGHPADSTAPGVNLIAGTHSASSPDTPNYASVMWGGANGCYPGNANVTLGLSSDDITSANIKYPP